jgi:hypothetical protein
MHTIWSHPTLDVSCPSRHILDLMSYSWHTCSQIKNIIYIEGAHYYFMELWVLLPNPQVVEDTRRMAFISVIASQAENAQKSCTLLGEDDVVINMHADFCSSRCAQNIS